MDSIAPATRLTGLDLSEEVASALRAVLPRMAERAVAAITVEVPSYADAFSGPMGRTIENAVQVALGAFLQMATHAEDSDNRAQLAPALDGAYDLGTGEARTGRSIDALLAAYRVGARVSWRELSTTAVQAGLSAATISRFAELVFAFIDELSAASVTGHAEELATAGRARERYLERLGQHLLAGEPLGTLEAAAEQANWTPPGSLTAVLLPAARAHGVSASFGPATLQVNAEPPDAEPAESLAVLLVPDMDGARRGQLMRVLSGQRAWVGPARPWSEVRASYRRALRCRSLATMTDSAVVDTDDHLVELILAADPEAVGDLRGRALAPLAGLRPSTADRLAETLRSWLLHQGHREAVAAELFVHPQTVRYRMTQLRELYGDRLGDPAVVMEILLSLAVPHRPAPPPSPGKARQAVP